MSDDSIRQLYCGITISRITIIHAASFYVYNKRNLPSDPSDWSTWQREFVRLMESEYWFTLY